MPADPELRGSNFLNTRPVLTYGRKSIKFRAITQMPEFLSRQLRQKGLRMLDTFFVRVPSDGQKINGLARYDDGCMSWISRY